MTEQPGSDGRRPDGPFPQQGGRNPGGPPQGHPAYGPPPYGGSPYGAQHYGPPHYGAPQYGAPPAAGAGYGRGAPGEAPPVAAVGSPPAGAPGQAPPSHPPNAAGSPPPPLQRPKKGNGGKIALIVVGVVLVVLVGGGYLAYRALTGLVSGVTGGTPLAGAGAGCSFVTADDVNGTLGGNYELVELGGLGGLGGLAGVALDSRVLADAPTCWGVDQADGKLVRIARYEGGDAADRFAAEKQTAQGGSQDQGNGVSVSTEGYLGEEIQAGDEAFCTTGDGTTAAGALVRTGDRLVYVSTTAAGQGAESVPQIDLSGDRPGFATDGENCRLSAAIAATVG